MDYTEQWLAKRDDPETIVPATKSTDQPSTTCNQSTTSSGPSKVKQRQRPRKKASAARFGPMRIQLAEEDAPTSQSESDSSVYDSFNEEETGLFMISYKHIRPLV